MERLRFSPTILRLLGEELVPSPDQGILELIKNAYDADASQCEVELQGVHVRGGSITIKDDGDGMTLDEIKKGWLVVGDSLKIRAASSRKGRPRVGSKGLGRLGALRLGRFVTLVTRPKSLSGIQYRVQIDWTAFENAAVVEDVPLAIVEEPIAIDEQSGTEVLISELPTPWKKTDIRRLARAILLLRDPFNSDRTFHATLVSDSFKEMEQLAKQSYFNECDYHLVAELDNSGYAHVRVETAGGTILFEADHSDLRVTQDGLPYRTVAASFELWEFNLGSKRQFSTKEVTTTAIKGWLAEFGGVRFYHRGVRSLPYGEPKNDWLDMNLRRVRNPEVRPSTNNSIGLVSVADPKGLLQQKTDRVGFVESEELDELRQFAGDVLEWMARARIRERDSRLKGLVEKSRTDKLQADQKVDQAIIRLSESDRRIIAPVIRELRVAHQAEIDLKDETAQLYFTLGTVGTTAAAFAHQTKVPISGIIVDSELLYHYLGDPSTFDFHRVESSDLVSRIKDEAGAIYSFSNVTLKLLEHEKRRSGRYAVRHLIDETIVLLTPYFDARHTSVVPQHSPDNPHVWCSKAAFEAILTNLLTNSLQAFERDRREGGERSDRQVRIATQVSGDTVLIRVMDNGPGIEGISMQDIWLPGRTLTEHGTGLGLAIVKDVVDEMRGWVEAEAHGDLGGAAFTITLPLRH